MTPIIADVSPAIIIPMTIRAVVEFNFDEKYKSKNKASIAPKNEAVHSSQELFNHPLKPKRVEKKRMTATPKPEADVIPKTEGSANGFLNNSCNINPLIGRAMPAKIVAIDLGNL